MVRILECLMSDDRYSVRQLSWIVVSDLERACELALRELLSDAHHRAVEVREDGRLVLALDRNGLLVDGGPRAGP